MRIAATLGRSTFRQIPDNQEVFVQEDGNASLIVEIVQVPDNVAEYNESVKYTVVPATPCALPRLQTGPTFVFTLGAAMHGLSP